MESSQDRVFREKRVGPCQVSKVTKADSYYTADFLVEMVVFGVMYVSSLSLSLWGTLSPPPGDPSLPLT